MNRLLLLFFTTLLLYSQTLFSQSTTFKNYHPCSFSISLPTNYFFKNMNEETSADYCDYEVKFKENGVSLQVHALLSSRFETTNINELFESAKSASEMAITYQFKSDHFYVLSWNKDDKIIYRKRYVGNNYIADLEIEYLASQKNVIEKYIGKISSSFKCD